MSFNKNCAQFLHLHLTHYQIDFKMNFSGFFISLILTVKNITFRLYIKKVGVVNLILHFFNAILITS